MRGHPQPINPGERYGGWTTVRGAPYASSYVLCECVCGETRYILALKRD
jgi:hypothetical protein